MTKQISRFRIIAFTNPSGEEIFRFTGSTRDGKEIRQNLRTHAEAEIRRQELEGDVMRRTGVSYN